MNAVSPESVGLSSSRLERIPGHMQRLVDDDRFPGVLTMVSRKGQLAHCASVGMSDLAAGKPLERDAIFRIYSMSKPITAVAVMMLHDNGLFRLGTPVSEFIPEFADARVFVAGTSRNPITVRAERPPTIRDLLTHTAGLAYGLSDDSPVDAIYRRLLTKAQGKDPRDMGDDALDDAFGDRMTVTLAELVADIARAPLANQPGAQWRYSMAMAVLGRVVEVVSGMPYARFLQERLFGPLGMVDAGFYVPADKLDRFAALYAPDPKGGLALVDSPQDSGIWKQPSVCPLGGEMMVSSADDYMRFAQMLLNGGELDGVRILGRKTVELMTMNHLAAELLPFGGPVSPAYGKGHGLGMAVTMDVAATQLPGSVGAFTWGGAASTTFWVDPQEELVSLLMTQVLANPYPIGEDFRVLVYQALT